MLKEINMIERSYCGSGGCMSCPFSHSDEAEMAQNYGCLPTHKQIIEMKEKSGHNWACHSDETVLCGGFAKYIKRNRPDLNLNEGQLISYETWCHEGEEKAIQQANSRELRQVQEEIQRITKESDGFKQALEKIVALKPSTNNDINACNFQFAITTANLTLEGDAE